MCDSDMGPDDASMFFTKLSPNHRYMIKFNIPIYALIQVIRKIAMLDIL